MFAIRILFSLVYISRWDDGQYMLINHGAVGENVSNWQAVHARTSDHSTIMFNLSLPN
jgi:hypothetical protein